jgi:uncharacterized membrane protein YwzB
LGDVAVRRIVSFVIIISLFYYLLRSTHFLSEAELGRDKNRQFVAIFILLNVVLGLPIICRVRTTAVANFEGPLLIFIEVR